MIFYLNFEKIVDHDFFFSFMWILNLRVTSTARILWKSCKDFQSLFSPGEFLLSVLLFLLFLFLESE